MTSIRDLLNAITAWARRGVAGKLLYVLGLHFDLLVEWAQVAIYSRYPGYYSDETLPIHARARKLDQGLGETAQQFADRLTKFWDAHENRGGPYDLLREVWEHYRHSDDGAFPVHLFYQSGAYYYMDATGAITRTDVEASTGGEDWAHWWLVYEWPDVVVDDGLWDDPGDWDEVPVGAWDVSSLTFAECQDLRLIPTKWNNAHSIGHLILLGPGQALWDVPDEDWNSEEDWDEGGDVDLVEAVIL